MSRTTIYAVHVGNYEPPEVVALYANRAAAIAHVFNRPGCMLEVSPLTVESEFVSEQPGVCHGCEHTLERVGNEWVCSERCRCTMAGCCPRRSS